MEIPANEKYIYSLLTAENKIKLAARCARSRFNKIFYISKSDILKILLRFHQSIIFSDEENYWSVLNLDYQNYLADKSKYQNDIMDVLKKTKRQRVTGEFFRHEYYLCFLKFQDNNGYENLNKAVREEYRPFINAGNSGIYGRLPILKSKEKEIINEAFRILFHHFHEYSGWYWTDYMPKENYPYTYVGKEGVIELYEKMLAQYE